jgi:hypothetical protein
VNHASNLVEVLDRMSNLEDDPSCSRLGEVGVLDDLVEELAAGTEFQHNVVVLPGLGEVAEFHDVRVVELALDLDLLKDVGSLRDTMTSVGGVTAKSRSSSSNGEDAVRGSDNG